MAHLAIRGGTPVRTEPFHPWPVYDDRDKQALIRELEAGQWGIGSPSIDAFEKRFAEFCQARYAVACTNGTDAITIALQALGVGAGDEVIIPPYTFMATAVAVLMANAIPVFADIDPGTYNIDPRSAAEKITPRTKAVMPVHMRGIPCDMDRIMAVAAKHGLRVIEDCAQACGGSYKGRRLGSIGHAGCFSLQQYKVITAGEGGMVVTRDRTIFERAAIRHDSAMCFWNPDETTSGPFPGENFRMNEMEGALGCVQFGRMEGILARTRELYKRIHAGIADCSGIQPHRTNDPEGDCGISVAVLLENGARAKWFAEALRAEGIPAGSMYDQGIPDRHIYRFWEYVMEKRSADAHGRPWTSPLHDGSRAYHPDMCPRTLDILGRTVIIGLSQTYGDQHADYIIEAIRKVAKG